MSEKVSMQDLIPFMEEAFENGQSFKIPIKGTSMLPLLVEGRDYVILEKPCGNLSVGDLPLYKRNDGTFVLHRIVGKKEDGSYVLCGDNQFLKEYGITDENVIGVVTSIIRDGKTFSVEDEKYKKYVHRSLKFLNVRYPYKRFRFLLSKIKAKIVNK